jgi:membrane-associated phospholipid phosphatase
MERAGLPSLAALFVFTSGAQRVLAQTTKPESSLASGPISPESTSPEEATTTPPPSNAVVDATSKPVEQPVRLDPQVQPYHSDSTRTGGTLKSTGWAFGANKWKSVVPMELSLGAAASAPLVVSLFINQRRSTWGPDSPHAPNSTWDSVSYGTVGAAAGIGLAYYVLKGEVFSNAGIHNPYVEALPVLVADAEAVILGLGVTEIVKREAGRCRPRAWTNGICDPSSDENFKAFPSGHTTIPSALAGVHFVESLREENVGTWLSFGGLEATAILTGVFRNAAGAHSWTDVLVGWVVGHVAGGLSALAHPSTELKGENPSSARLVAHPTVGFDGRVLMVSASF